MRNDVALRPAIAQELMPTTNYGQSVQQRNTRRPIKPNGSRPRVTGLRARSSRELRDQEAVVTIWPYRWTHCAETSGMLSGHWRAAPPSRYWPTEYKASNSGWRTPIAKSACDPPTIA